MIKDKQEQTITGCPNCGAVVSDDEIVGVSGFLFCNECVDDFDFKFIQGIGLTVTKK